MPPPHGNPRQGDPTLRCACYAGTDTQLLADELQVGKGTIYRYFQNKEELFLAAADHIMAKLRERIDAAVIGVADPLEKMRAGILAYLTFFFEKPDYVELLIQERALFKDRETPTFFRYRERNVQRWRDLYRGLMIDGRLRDMPPERITDVLSDLTYGTMCATISPAAIATRPSRSRRFWTLSGGES